MTTTIEQMRSELAQNGRVEFYLGRTGQFLRNPAAVLGLRRSDARSPQVVVDEIGVWAAVEGFPASGVPWGQILEVHLTKVNFSSFIDVSIRSTDTPERRRTFRLPHRLAVDPEDLAKWIVMELMDRGNPI
jgi:hypothetical protein